MRLLFVLALTAAGLALPAFADVNYDIRFITTNPAAGDVGDTLEIFLTNSTAGTIGGFQFEITSDNPNITFTLADMNTAPDTYVLAGDSFAAANPPFFTTTPDALTLDASDFSNSGVATDPLPVGVSGLARIFYNVDPSAPTALTTFSFSGGTGENNLSDGGGNPITVTASSEQITITGISGTPEPSSWILFGSGMAALLAMTRFTRKITRARSAS